MKKQLMVTILLLSVLFSCKKEDKDTYNEVNSVVIYTGDTAADGCGWLIRIDSTVNNNSANTYYSPVNLADDFKKDKLPVIIGYSTLKTKFQCGNYPNSGTTQIHINAIRKR